MAGGAETANIAGEREFDQNSAFPVRKHFIICDIGDVIIHGWVIPQSYGKAAHLRGGFSF